MAAKVRNEVAVGMMTILVLVLTIYIVMALGDWSSLFTKSQHITIRLPYKTGLKGLAKGSPIYLGGAKIGQITYAGILKTPEEPKSGDDVYVAFTMEIPDRYPILDDCVLAPQSNMLGGQASLAIKDIGLKGKEIKDGDTVDIALQGSISDAIDAVRSELDAGVQGSLLWLLKDIVTKIDEQVTLPEIQETLMTKIHIIFDNLNAQLDAANEHAAVTKINKALANLDATISEINVTISDNKPTITTALVSAKNSLQEIETLINGPAAKMMASLNETVEKINQATPAILETLQNTLERAETAMTSATSALDNADSLITKTKDIVTINKPNIDNILRNLNEAAIHVKVVMRDIRHNPWRLRYPDEARKQAQGIIGAADGFASGAERLENAATSLNALLDASKELPDKQANIEKMLQELQESFDSFQEAEDTFWKKLK